tara:strand:- start:69 stop:335 length:267 start_codon:yes stop_codon:yes gene_type:complete
MNRIKEITGDNKTRAEKRREARAERTTGRRQWRLDKIEALTAKFYAVATKRKWLVFMMALGIAIYFIITSGGGFSFVGILDTVKGFFK